MLNSMSKRNHRVNISKETQSTFHITASQESHATGASQESVAYAPDEMVEEETDNNDGFRVFNIFAYLNQ